MPIKRLRFRTGTHADTPNIVTLLNQTFRTPIDTATWEWYVYGNPLGHSRVYLAAEPDDRIVGTIAFAPISLIVNGSPVIGDFAHHLVLEPTYRDTLSFVAFNRHALSAQASLGRELVIGPPNRTAYPIHKTIMKWVDFGYLECLRKLEPAALSHDCRETDQFSGDVDRFTADVSRHLTFYVEKNHHWMNWRFCNRPGAPYTVYTFAVQGRLRGYVVLKRWQDADGYRKAHILDMHASDADALSQLVAAAESYASDCDEVNLWAIQGYPYRDALEAMGFTVNPAARQPFIARPYDGSPIRFPDGPSSFGYGDGDTLY
jgi:Acetyltransferase (GNAT) domain